tara:strand:- start:289 stop:636 length:348 start_codon:yes stop_codon:yes gene_type:complete
MSLSGLTPEAFEATWSGDLLAWATCGLDSEGRRVDVHAMKHEEEYFGVSIDMSENGYGSTIEPVDNDILVSIAEELKLDYADYGEGIGMEAETDVEAIGMLEKFLDHIGFKEVDA